MPTLDPKLYSGQPRPVGNCGCPTSDADLTAQSLVPVADNCSPGPAHEPVSEAAYQCSVMHGLQSTIDAANRVSHEIGERPYRVFLVWQRRDEQRNWVEVRRKELIPVRLVALDTVDLALGQSGIQPDGAVTLTEISPILTNEGELVGRFDGDGWETSDFEFFYEVVRYAWCDGRPTPKRRRFTIASEPHFDGGAGTYRVQLLDQEIARSAEGQDRTVGDPTYSGPRIVT